MNFVRIMLSVTILLFISEKMNAAQAAVNPPAQAISKYNIVFMPWGPKNQQFPFRPSATGSFEVNSSKDELLKFVNGFTYWNEENPIALSDLRVLTKRNDVSSAKKMDEFQSVGDLPILPGVAQLTGENKPTWRIYEIQIALAKHIS